jgi:hypothetical protein
MRSIFIVGLVLMVCLVAPGWAESLPDAPGSLRGTFTDSALVVDSAPLLIKPAAPGSGFAVVAADRPAPRVMDRNFIILGALVFGLTAVDVEMTQHCLHAKTCVELNPTLPHSRLGMYAANTPVNLAVMYFSYRRKGAHKRGWWIAPLVDVGAHAVGIGSNLRFTF